MRFQHVYEAVHHQPWFISASGYSSIQALLDKAIEGKLPIKADGEGDDFMSNFVRVRPPMSIDGNGIATISIFGVVGLHLTGIEKTCGNTDYKDIEREIGEAVGQGARGILFVVDSPGGMVRGCDECAQAIARAGVPTVAFTDTQMCSAAYYISAATEAIVATQSAEIGNIGAILPWTDKDKMWDLVGIKFNPIFNDGADLKSTGKGPSLTGDQRNFLQDSINQKAELFHKHISDYRAVDDEVFRAGWYAGQKAIDLGLVDYTGDQRAAYGVLLSKVPI